MNIPASSYFHEKCIYFLRDFEIEEGVIKDKFLLVLAIQSSFIYFCLTTSQGIDELTSEYKKTGCHMHKSHKFFQFYFLPANIPFGSESYSFKVDTLISFQTNIRKRNIADFDKYLNANSCDFKTELDDSEYKPILGCVLKSIHCPIGYESLFNKRLVP